MSNLVDLVIAGLATGAIYALVAIGFTLLWQTSQTINFAQGEFVMLPAFLMLAAMRAGAPFWLADHRRPPAVGRDARLRVQEAAGRSDAASRRAAARHRDDGAVGRHEGIGQDSSSAPRRSPSPRSRRRVPFRSSAPRCRCRASACSRSASSRSIGLNLFLERTSTGRQMQAAAQNPTVARIIGIPVERMIMLTFVINAVAGRARLAAGDADLSRQILLRRYARPGRLHRRDHRRLQSGARRDRRRAAHRRGRQSRRRLYLDAIPRGGSAGAADRHHPVPAARGCSGGPRSARYDARAAPPRRSRSAPP